MYEFRFEIYELTDKGLKMIGNDDINIKSDSLKSALSEAWEQKNDEGSLTNHYFYKMTLR